MFSDFCTQLYIYICLGKKYPLCDMDNIKGIITQQFKDTFSISLPIPVQEFITGNLAKGI